MSRGVPLGGARGRWVGPDPSVSLEFSVALEITELLIQRGASNEQKMPRKPRPAAHSHFPLQKRDNWCLATLVMDVE